MEIRERYMRLHRPFVGITQFSDQSPLVGSVKTFLAALVVLSLLAACQFAAQEDGQAKNSQPSAAGGKSDDQSPADHLSSYLPVRPEWKKGMAYADFRRAALETGWSPVVDPQCNANVIGENFADLCSAHPGLDDCHVCAEIPELGACSGDGYCGMTFTRHAQNLEVTTYGMTDDRKIRGSSSRLQVVGWRIETKAP
jgi:hypothetical protein